MALSLTLAAPVAASASQSFSDVPSNHWAFDAIEAANADGVMTGTGDRMFSPDNELTVAEFATIITRAFYADEVAASTASGKWYAKYMDVFLEHLLLAGLDEEYGPEDMLNRGTMAVIMHCVLMDKGIEDPPEEVLEAAEAKVVEPGFASLRHVYRRGILVCFNFGLLNGVDEKGTINVEGAVTRSQTATIYLRLRDYLKDHGVSVSTGTKEPIPSTPTEPDPTSTPTATEPSTPTGNTAFKFLPGETTVEQMMARINAATPAYREGYLTNGKPITDENILEMLAEIKETMPDGTEWNTDDKYNYSNKLGYGGGCNGFGYAVSDALFGEDAPVFEHNDFSKLKIGDVIWIRDALPDSPNETYSHVMVVMSHPNSIDRFRTCSGNVSGEVSWPASETITTTSVPPADTSFASHSIIYTRYGT